MQKERQTIDISHRPELLRLAQEVQANREIIVLTRDGEELVEVRPMTRTYTSRAIRASKSKADIEAFRAAAGAWKALVDAKALKDTLDAERGSNRPPVSL